MAQTARSNGGDAVERLAALAGRRGTLTIDMLRRVVPVGTMPVEELAAIISALEDRGVTVDIDPALLSPGARPFPPVGPTPAAWPRPEPAPSAPPPPPPVTPLRPAATRPAPGPAAPPQQSRSATPIVLLALLVVIVLAFVWLSLS
jgi:hypothetical protein